MNESITCTACRLSIRGADERRSHYRSDLHRVNLKRKVGGLGPLTETELLGRVQALRVEQTTREREKQSCTLCNKKFSSVKALENHNNSRRHRDALMRIELSSVGSDSRADSETREEMDDDVLDDELEKRMVAWRGDTMFSGIFDESWHASAKEAYERACMHGFFVPYKEFVNDWDGLMRYAGQKVGIGYACMCCDRGFGSVDAVRRHMKDVGHCHMGDDWVEEYGEFYRWAEGDAGWVEAEGEETKGNFEDVEYVEDDGLEMADKVDEGDGEGVGLVVGDKIVGHRSFVRYYGQAAGRRDDLRVAVVANKSALKELGMMGWKKVDKQTARSEKMEMRRKQKFELVVGRRTYYTRKVRFKQKMSVLNSGYRA